MPRPSLAWFFDTSKRGMSRRCAHALDNALALEQNRDDLKAMGKFVDKYKSWDDFHRNVFILCCISVIGALVGVGFIFLDNIGVLFGWLLGSVVNMVAYVTIAKGSARLLTPSTEPKQGYFALVGAVLRLFLYAGVLLLSGFCSFKWGTLSHGYCNLIATSLALMPTWIVLVITMLIRAPKLNAKPTPKAEDEEKKEENKQ